MNSKPLTPRPSGSAHPAASGPTSTSGTSVGATPATGRHGRGALAVLVLSLLHVVITPLPNVVSGAVGSLGLAGYLLSQGLWLVAVMVTFALWAAVIWWLRRSRDGDGLELGPLLALGVITLMSLIDPARATASLLVDAFTADDSMVIAFGAIGVASTIASVLAALVLAGLAALSRFRRRPLQRQVTVRLDPVTLTAVLVALLALFTIVFPLLTLALETAALRSVLPISSFHPPQIASGLLSAAALVVLALVIARTEGRLHRLAWAVPIVLWTGVLATGAVSALQTAMMAWGEQSPATAGPLGLVLTVGVHLLTAAAATVVAAILLTMSRRERSSVPRRRSIDPVAQA